MGSKSAPKEKDYTKQKANFAQAEGATRTAQANAYNDLVSNYNNSLNSQLGVVNDFSSQVNDLTIRDADRFDSYFDQLDDLRFNVDGLNFNETKPIFESVVQSPYGAVQVSVPTLNNVDSSTATRLDQGIQSSSSFLERLKADRESEENRIDTFRTGLLQQLAGVDSTLGSLDISDEAQMRNLRSQLGEVDTQRSLFTSDILDQVKPGGFTTVMNEYTDADSRLQDLFDQRAAEEARIENYRSGLQSAYDGFNNRLSGLTIADEDAMLQLQRDIDAKQLDSSRFSSLLDYNFGNSLNTIQDAENQLANLRQDRESELARIESSLQNADAAAFSIENSVGNAGIYNRNTLDTLQRQIDAAQRDITGFDSLLEADFSDPMSRFDTAESTIEQLLARRNERLTGYGSQISDVMGGVEGADLWNEDTFQNSIDDLLGLQTELSRFSGQDASDIGYDLEDALSGARGRLDDLYDFRSDFETDLQNEVSALDATSFNSETDFTRFDNRYNELQGLIEQYGATSASDELAQYLGILDDGKAQIAQATAAQNTYNPASARISEIIAGSGVDLSPEQYLALLQQIEQEEEENTTGAFSQNILRL